VLTIDTLEFVEIGFQSRNNRFLKIVDPTLPYAEQWKRRC